MKITEIKPSERKKDRILVHLEDGTLLRMDTNTFVQLNLYRDKELCSEEIEEIVSASRLGEFKRKALNSLSYRAQSRRELEKKLSSYGASEDEIEQICDRLQELRLLNDEEYAKNLVNHYIKRGYGIKKLKQELSFRGIERELWAELLEGIFEDTTAIDNFVFKKFRGNLPDEKEKKRTFDALLRRGFNYDEINSSFRRYFENLEDIE